MSLLLEIVLQNGFILDVFGIIGLGLLGLAAVQLGRRFDTPGSRIVTWGAVTLIAGRLVSISLTHWVDGRVQAQLGKATVDLIAAVPLVLLTAGLASVVWGLWSHERGLAGKD